MFAYTLSSPSLEFIHFLFLISHFSLLPLNFVPFSVFLLYLLPFFLVWVPFFRDALDLSSLPVYFPIFCVALFFSSFYCIPTYTFFSLSFPHVLYPLSPSFSNYCLYCLLISVVCIISFLSSSCILLSLSYFVACFILSFPLFLDYISFAFFRIPSLLNCLSSLSFCFILSLTDSFSLLFVRCFLHVFR